jgi:predicted nucleic acid-binding protein
MAKTVFVDTGVLVALLSARDQFHTWAVAQAVVVLAK